jgi:centromere protein C
MAVEDEDALVREPSPEVSDEEEADMEVETPPPRSASKSNARSRPPPESEEEDEEDEGEDEEEEEETSRKPSAKSRKTAAAVSPRAQKMKQSPVAKKAASSPHKKTTAAKARPKPTAAAAKKTAAKTPDVQAPRRSSRRKIPPLAFWRNEKIVYELDHEHHRPQIKDIVFHEEKPEDRPVRKRATKKKSTKKAKRQKLDDESEESDQDIPEWEKNDYVETEVFEYPDTDERTKRLVAWAPGHEPFRDIKNSSYRLATLYDRDSGFSAAGVISLQPNGQKPMKPSKQNSYIFFVIKGRVEVNVSDATFSLRKGGSFEVPRGNYYSITNVHPGETRLFFTQSTDTLVNQELEAAMEEEEE